MRYLVSFAAPTSSMRLLCFLFFFTLRFAVFIYISAGNGREKKHSLLVVAAEAVVFIYSNVFIHFHFSRMCAPSTWYMVSSAGAEEITTHM